jgi:alkylhydroperoxidase/carboxymuconolactone decarboxylase family protein YurZ
MAKARARRASAEPSPKPPQAYSDFIARYPDLGRAWDTIAKAGERGPLDERTARLVKLGIAVGAFREGAVRSSVRKALALGIGRDEIEQVVALAAGTLGMPSTVAIDSWVQPVLVSRGAVPAPRPAKSAVSAGAHPQGGSRAQGPRTPRTRRARSR